jgi:hypothetical protein
VRLAAWGRQGLERLARYCARPSFASAHLDRLNDETLAYRLRKPLARIHDVLPLVCSCCGRAMRILAFVTKAASVRRFLAHVGEAASPPAILPSRAPLLGECAWEKHGGEDFDQRTSYADEPC